MTAPGDILETPDRVGRAFAVAAVLHAALIGGLFVTAHIDAFGAKNAGGASVAIQAVNSIPIQQHNGPPNPLATDTQSEVPQAPAKPQERVKKEEAPPPDAVALKTKTAKKTPADVASERNRFRTFKELDPYQVYNRSAPAVSNPAFAVTGAGQIGVGQNTTLGNLCPGYAAQIQQLLASHWRTDTVDNRIQTAPTVIADFDLAKDGTVSNVRILQGSGISPLDASVQRAILDSNPLPRIQDSCGRDHASVEFYFELKR